MNPNGRGCKSFRAAWASNKEFETCENRFLSPVPSSASACWAVPASAAPFGPVSNNLAPQAQSGGNSLLQVQYRGGGRYHGRGGGRYHGRGGGGNGGAVAAGVSAVCCSAPSSPTKRSAGSSVDYCAQRFRSYDPNSQTYLGYDGVRHSCP